MSVLDKAKQNFEVLKHTVKLARFNAKQLVRETIDKADVKEMVRTGRDRINELEVTRKYEVVRNYIKGKDFENDLDEIIASLQLEKIGTPKTFTDIEGRNKRIAAKLAYLRNQAGMVISFCGAAGSKIGAKVGRGNPAVIADGAVVGATAGVIIVGFFAGKVFLQRYQASGAIDITAEALEALPTGG